MTNAIEKEINRVNNICADMQRYIENYEQKFFETLLGRGTASGDLERSIKEQVYDHYANDVIRVVEFRISQGKLGNFNNEPLATAPLRHTPEGYSHVSLKSQADGYVVYNNDLDIYEYDVLATIFYDASSSYDWENMQRDNRSGSFTIRYTDTLR